MHLYVYLQFVFHVYQIRDRNKYCNFNLRCSKNLVIYKIKKHAFMPFYSMIKMRSNLPYLT